MVDSRLGCDTEEMFWRNFRGVKSVTGSDAACGSCSKTRPFPAPTRFPAKGQYFEQRLFTEAMGPSSQRRCGWQAFDGIFMRRDQTFPRSRGNWRMQRTWLEHGSSLGRHSHVFLELGKYSLLDEDLYRHLMSCWQGPRSIR